MIVARDFSPWYHARIITPPGGRTHVTKCECSVRPTGGDNLRDDQTRD